MKEGQTEGESLKEGDGKVVDADGVGMADEPKMRGRTDTAWGERSDNRRIKKTKATHQRPFIHLNPHHPAGPA
jgi:hypothetical protein